MPSSMHRFSFDKLKDHFSSHNTQKKTRPSTSASVPNFRLAKKFRTRGRSHSFKATRDVVVTGDGEAGDDGVTSDTADSINSHSTSSSSAARVSPTTPSTSTEAASMDADRDSAAYDGNSGLSETNVKTSQATQISDPEVVAQPGFATVSSSCCDPRDSLALHDALGIDTVSQEQKNRADPPTEGAEDPSMLISSVTTESVYSQAGTLYEASPSSCNYARSPLDDSIMATLDELEHDALDMIFCVEHLEPPLDTIYEEDGTTGSRVTASSSLATRDNIQMLSSAPSATESLPLSGQLSPYPTTRAPANSPASCMNLPFPVQSLPSMSSLLASDFEAPVSTVEFNGKMGTMPNCYVKTLPPLVQVFAFMADQSTVVSCCLTRGCVDLLFPFECFEEVD